MTNDFMSLVRLGIGNDSIVPPLSEKMDWGRIEILAKLHGLMGVLVDGINRLPQSIHPHQTIWLRWIGEVMQEYEDRYAFYKKAVVDLASFYNTHGYKMMLLKGMSCGIEWPKPEHRPCGDIDIWLFGKQKEADKTIETELSVKVDNSQHHHSVFQWHGFTVENHYDFINIHHHKSNVELEKIFKALGSNDANSFELDRVKVFLPSANLQALFLVKHLANHFSTERVTIRQLLDWAFFAKQHNSEIEWVWLEETFEQFGLMPFYKIINAICVSDLGFDVKLFPCVQFDPFMKERVLNDILSPEFSGKEPKHIWKRVPFKYRRWRSNGWKRELCFNESAGSAFCCGVKSHIMKPASI